MPLVDFYSESNTDFNLTTRGGANTRQAQSFTGDGSNLQKATFWLKKVLSPTGNITAKIYAHSGTFGTSSVATGTAIATSDTVDISTLSTSYALVDFTFSGAEQITLTNATNYVVSVEYTGGDASNYLHVGCDQTSVTHSGNFTQWNGGWIAYNTYDVCFYVYSSLPPSKLIPGGFYMRQGWQ